MRYESPQLPLALRYPPDQRLDTLVAPDAALRPLLAAFAASTTRQSLFVAGPAGTGKTHLAIAVCAETERRGQRTFYLPARTAAGRLADALMSLHDYDLVAIDGIDDVAGDREDEIALFDLHNRLHDGHRRVLYTANAWPDELPLTLPDLQSRLAQCTRVALSPLDDAGRHDMLRLRAARRGLQMDAAAIDWILRRVDRDLPALTALLDRLDRASLASQRRVTVPFVRQLLADEIPLSD